MAERFLVEFQEFYPFGAYVKSNGELVPVGIHDGDEFPSSQTVIENLNKNLSEQLFSTKIHAYALTYDAKVTNNRFPESIDSVIIKIVTNTSKVIYYFPYKLDNIKVDFYESWVELQN